MSSNLVRHVFRMISVSNLGKKYPHGDSSVVALQGVNFELAAGASLAICGSSGAGKSTLLSLIGGLDQPSEGTVKIKGQDIFAHSADQQSEFRNKHLGFVFQFHHLLDDFTILENVSLPLWVQNRDRNESLELARALLAKVGLAGKEDRYPQELSGGEQQRAAIARAVIHKPELIFADEPTGNLDDDNGERVFELLCELNRDLGATLVVVTHNKNYAKKLNHILELDGGQLKRFQ